MSKQKKISRRNFLKNTAIIGAGAALAACGAPAATKAPATEAPAAAPTATEAAAAAATATTAPPKLDLPFEVAPEAINPLNLEAGTSVEGVFFEGGLGREYIDNAADLFRKLHPDNEMTVEGIQRVGEHLRPRFIGGNPPDVIDNSGAGSLDRAALVDEGQMLDLAPLLAAPALDTPGKTFGETLFPGSQVLGDWSGTQYELNITMTVFGIWHSQTLFEKKGWKYPKTWDEMLGLCDTIKSDGISPWTYQGKYPQYMLFGLLTPLIYKVGGLKALMAVDNLEDGAWLADPVVKAVSMIAELANRDYIMPGTEGLTHTEAQAAWLQGKAAFIPCGSWLENEMREMTPDDFNMVVETVPGPTEDTFKSLLANAGEPYFVPSQGKNPTGGMEFMRCMMSKANAKFMAENVGIVMPVLGGAEGVKMSSALESAIKLLDQAGDQIFSDRYYLAGWYADLKAEAKDRMGDLLTKRISVDEFVEAVQKKADEIKADPDVKKYTRTS